MKLKTWLLSNIGVIWITKSLMLLVLIKSIFPPWAPYFIFCTILAILIPLILRTYRFGSFRAAMQNHWRLILGAFVTAVIWDMGVAGWLYKRILVGFGLVEILLG